jgi:uncharacterized BrkB/YihY/UPF0761 family membrane protein
MKKNLLTILIIFFLIPLIAKSADIINPLTCKTFPECIEKIIGFIFWVAMAIVPIIIIIAGFLFLTSGGDPEKVRTAKRVIFWAVIGLAIILLAKGIISLIKTVIGS